MSATARVALTRGDWAVTAQVPLVPGHVVALTGPNGCGKTTVLRCLAGLEPGADTDDHRPAEERGLGVVFQDLRLRPWARVRDEVGLGGPAAGWLAAVGLVGLEAVRVKTLSGGQAQRLALARALARRPVALLLDEPWSAVDEAGAGTLRALVRAQQLPVVIATHDGLDVAWADEQVTLG